METHDDEQILKALEILDQLSEQYRNEMICKMAEADIEKYRELLDHVKFLERVKKGTPGCPENLKAEKGRALEELVGFLLRISGNLFLIDRNIRTATNELDQFVSLTPKGKILLSRGVLNSKLSLFIGECKNYSNKVDVTYVGKFCSLLLTNQMKLGILFSYYGITGTKWTFASGLIKKFYLHKEKDEDRYCIVDFCLADFESILAGNNFLQIINDRLVSLRLDTDYSTFISKHPAEE